uniref:Uncharacterized protein n=1 Tax=Desertifilum tharense IPPAS B-1220 TaxID=1781255 RepID=A0ACD5GTJ4_9CYAN
MRQTHPTVLLPISPSLIGSWELGIRGWGRREFRVNPNYFQTSQQS